ncbi:hypothetical protein COY87_05715 [Candidatus Roizmanbacteria bacterium CG_4_10_14_0_8_um_filter_33_9]|uniref:Aspartate aminotransferase family protein n=1 Tax=Candidatus Roizmanbacteria bacterium CG_4_10_14_0_8_um_filter_33_9 TaxID=1974826 RepID=A0A2M7QGT2_9BACT|nr:MAG: hypothetical protein COY87_05715 [Candidatus Roizmanbacteria bacterium CG_4_10_14_0_8_um_filter_33_9]
MIKNRIIYNSFSDYQFKLTKAQESFIWDNGGNKLIDFTSGWNVTNLGWNNPEIAEAINIQAKKNVYAPMWTADPIQEEYAKQLTQSLPKALNAVGRATGGTEANEEAIKTVRAYTGRKKILGFKDTYHGQSFSTLAIGYSPDYAVSKAVGPFVPGFIQMNFPRILFNDKNELLVLKKFSEELEKNLSKKNVAAIICEAGIITGWGSTFVAPKGFLKEVRKLTKKYGTLLILDEVGTGFSRCGKLFGMELEGITPDIVTFAKGMVNGAVAIGVMITTNQIAQATLAKSNLTSTFGWTPVACAAALKTLEIHKRDNVWEKSKKDGEYLLKTLQLELKNNPLIEDINGIGMEIGVHLRKNEKSKMREMIEKAGRLGLHLAYADDYNFQIMPPLTIERDVLNKGIEIFIKMIKFFS